MDPFTIGIGVIAAATSMASAITSIYLKRKSNKVTVSIDGKKIEMSSEDSRKLEQLLAEIKSKGSEDPERTPSGGR
jgi:hypothetical protein